MNNFHYVYILVSETDETRHYTGITEDLESRLKAHNNGQVPHTSKYRPWRIETAVAFSCLQKAANFEKYLNPIPVALLPESACNLYSNI